MFHKINYTFHFLKKLIVTNRIANIENSNFDFVIIIFKYLSIISHSFIRIQVVLASRQLFANFQIRYIDNGMNKPWSDLKPQYFF